MLKTAPQIRQEARGTNDTAKFHSRVTYRLQFALSTEAAIYILASLWFNGPPMSDQFILWVHLLGLAVYFGSGVMLTAGLLPLAARLPGTLEKQHFLAQVLKVYNPLNIGALGVVLMTGAFGLTSYKAAFPGLQFFSLLGGVLGLKLLLVFLVINLSAVASLGMGHRIVRTEVRGEEMAPDRLARLVTRMQICTILALALTAWTVWVSLDLTRIARLPA